MELFNNALLSVKIVTQTEYCKEITIHVLNDDVRQVTELHLSTKFHVCQCS